jgi:hypothetical protein
MLHAATPTDSPACACYIVHIIIRSRFVSARCQQFPQLFPSSLSGCASPNTQFNSKTPNLKVYTIGYNSIIYTVSRLSGRVRFQFIREYSVQYRSTKMGAVNWIFRYSLIVSSPCAHPLMIILLANADLFYRWSLIGRWVVSGRIKGHTCYLFKRRVIL